MNHDAIRPRATAAIAITLGLAVLGVQPLLAQSAPDLDARAAAEYNRGLDARDAGQNRAACDHFRNAETLYHNSIMALMSYPMNTEEARDDVKRMADQQQSSLDGAKAKAAEVCGRPDSPVQTSSSDGRSNYVGIDWEAKKLELQRTRKLAVSQYNEANRLWDAGDHTAACQTIRLAAANFASVTVAMKANPDLESAFTPVSQHYADEAYVIELRDGTFCKA